jgi:tetratricopeptide (TPR) repeat protein
VRPSVQFTPPALKKDEEEREEVRVGHTNSIESAPTRNIAGVSAYSVSLSANYKWEANAPQAAETEGATNMGGEQHHNATIEVPEFRSDKDYIETLRATQKQNAYQVYLKLRKDYISTPTFYYDVASWFFQQNKKDTGLMILSNLAELDLEDAELYKLLGYQLKQQGYYAKELWVAQKVMEWRPMDPQSIRDYALALEDNGQYQQALEAFYSILSKSYSPEAANRDEGIEEIIVMEINELIARHRAQLNLSKIDKRLIERLPVNIRVVLNWNKADTDIDLWLTDPNGEKCYYSNPRTAMGGRISNDFTAGFGPEQFLLRKAIKGKYLIQTNFFGENQLSISGPTTLMAEIYLYYADGKQSRKVITLQSGENGSDGEGITIGSFQF